MDRPCAICGSIGCDHTLLEQLYGIREMARDEVDEAREERRRDSDERSEDDLRRREQA